jgi:glutaredoxin 3
MNSTAGNSAKVEVYSTALCPYCTRARQLLQRKGVVFTEYRVDKEPGLREEMERRAKRSSVPQIFIDGQHIGGFDDMAALDVDDELDKLLGIANA